MWKFSTKIKKWKFDRKKKVEILHKNKKVEQKESLRKSSKTLLDAMTNHQNISCNTRNRVVIPGGCGRVGVFFTADILPVNK